MDNLTIEKDGVTYINHAALFEAEIQPAIMVPFFGVKEPVIIRRLTHAQIKACGNFSLIETIEDIINKKRKLSVREMIAYSETQYALVKKALVSPTLDQIMSISKADVEYANAQKEIEGINKLIEELPIGPKRSRLENDRDILKMELEFVLPADFISTIISFALDVNGTDIKEVSEEMLYEAATLAKLGHDNPCDHIHGNLSEFNKEDINNRAWIIYFQRHKKDD